VLTRVFVDRSSDGFSSITPESLSGIQATDLAKGSTLRYQLVNDGKRRGIADVSMLALPDSRRIGR
jgi:hypothetical protein